MLLSISYWYVFNYRNVMCQGLICFPSDYNTSQLMPPETLETRQCMDHFDSGSRDRSMFLTERSLYSDVETWSVSAK